MLRPASEINFPPTEADRMRANMVARMEELSSSTEALMAIIAERVGAELEADTAEVAKLSAEQDRLLDNMHKIVRG